MINTPWNANTCQWSFSGRYENLVAGRWDQFNQFTSPPGDPFALMWGIAAHVQEGESTGEPTLARDEDSWFGFTADVSAQFGGANLFGALIYQYIDDAESRDQFNILGVVVQGGTYFTEKLEGYARVEYGTISFNNDVPDLWVLTLGGNYYFDGQDLKLSADFGIAFNQVIGAWSSTLAGYRPDVSGAEPQLVFRTQFQLMF